MATTEERTKLTEITLRAEEAYNPSYPPRNAKKGYIAKITGRAAGPVKYEREFLGQHVSVLEGEEGLYEKQRGDKKGGCTRWYYVILSHPEHGLIISTDCEDEVPKIAKLLDAGIAIDDAVEIVDLRPSAKHEGRMIFDARPRTLAAARKNATAASVNDAVTQCLDVMRGLDAAQQKKVLAEIRKQINSGD